MKTNKAFADRGMIWQDLEREVAELRSDDSQWKKGVFHDYWPNAGGSTQQVSAEISKLFAHHVLLGRFSQPSVLEMATQTEAMIKEVLDAPEGSHCTFTSGGTESNFLAVLAAREWARVHRPHVGTPEIVLSRSTHPSFDKAAGYLGMEVIRVPVAEDLRADVNAMESAVSPNTTMLVGSAPPYPHGVIDPIEDIAHIAEAHQLWCHVDACVGGFLLPFLRELGRDLPATDLNVPGVTSMSADLHKYGYTPHGISTLSLRNRDDLRYHEFDFDDWSFGRFRVPAFAGTRGASPLAGAWATLKYLGREGYLNLARGMLRSTALMREGIESINGLEMLAESQAGVFVFTSRSLDVEAVAEGMIAEGYSSSLCREPVGMHLLMEPVEDERIIQDYLSTLAVVVDRVRSGALSAAGGQVDYV